MIGFGDATNAAIIGPIVVAFIALLTAAWRFGLSLRDELRHRVGTPNGHGNVVEMLERVLAGQTGQDNRIAALEGTANRNTARIDKVATEHGQRLGVIEQDIATLKTAPPCRATIPTPGGSDAA